MSGNISEKLAEYTENAYSLCKQNHSHDDLIDLLNSPDINLKCFALLSLETVKTNKEAKLVINCLKSDDSRIRSHASDLIYKNLSENKIFFDREEYLETVVNAIKDSNPKVCANIKNSLQYLTHELTLFEKLGIIIEECSKDIKKEKNIFNLYWSLYALETLIENNLELENIENIIKIPVKLLTVKEYQIKERLASIVRIINSKNLTQNNAYISQNLTNLFDAFKNDENFYVKNALFK